MSLWQVWQDFGSLPPQRICVVPWQLVLLQRFSVVL
jgi:hypothetical protein